MRAHPVLFFLFISSFFTECCAQWSTGTSLTWMKGDNTINQSGVYGTKGIADPTNKPGARDYSATWTDANNTLWMFGGYGYDETQQGYLNDLWKFDPINNQWTWAGGDKTINNYGVYGTKGVANSTNKPGSVYACISWTDKNGNLWLYGGFGYTANDIGFLNDLWKYETATGQWTWVHGNNAIGMPAVYGTKGVAAASNRPGSRYGSKTWTDNSGNLWMFGGYGMDETNAGILNDLWKYNIETNTWTWVNGNKTIDQPGKYGSQGIGATSTQPGARYLSNSWMDSQGNFWLFGGYGYDATSPGILNDLWKYEPATNIWTWMKGSNTAEHTAVYGTQGIADVTNQPGSRYVSVSWVDEHGDLLLFGGFGYDETRSGYLNDLWKFDIQSSTWTWMKGDTLVDQVGVYGTQGVPAYTNKTGSRNSCISWADNTGNLWMFGGYGYDQAQAGVLNDLWKITELQILPVRLIEFNGSLNNDVANLQWKTTQEEGAITYNVQRSFTGNEFTAIGTVTGNGAATSNEYAFSDNLAGTSSSQVYYRLEMLHANGEISYSKLIRLERKNTGASISIFPNPASNSLTVSFHLPATELVSIRITDSKGALMKSISRQLSQGSSGFSVDISSWAKGIYFFTTMVKGEMVRLRFIKVG